MKKYTVTNRARDFKQPYGGFINPKQFEITELNDNIIIDKSLENLDPRLVGTVVDYLTRFMINSDVNDAFKISLNGAINVGELHYATLLTAQIFGLDDESIDSACKLVGYDVAYRKGRAFYTKPVQSIVPNDTTIENIRTMVNRSLDFFMEYGPIKQDGFSVEGGICHGDGDFITKDTLWDFKVISTEPDNKQTLQLLMYWLMGKHSKNKEFKPITKLGIFNPRKNKIYLLETSQIPKEIIKTVEKEVIGY